MQAPPPIPKKQASHWRWIVAALCLLALLVVLGLAGLVVFGEHLLKSSDVCTGALAKAKSSSTVTATLGTPIEEGFFVTGSISEDTSSGRARFIIPISGPKGSGHLYASATRSDGEWQFDDLKLLVDKTREQIDLLNTNR